MILLCFFRGLLRLLPSGRLNLGFSFSIFFFKNFLENRGFGFPTLRDLYRSTHNVFKLLNGDFVITTSNFVHRGAKL